MCDINWKEEYASEDKSIFIRPIEYSDIDDIVRWRNSDFVKKRFIYRGLFTYENQMEWIKNQVETGHVAQMMICKMDSGEAIGCVYLRDISELHHKAEYGIFIGEEADTGHGYGTAACKLMLKYGFEKLQLHRIYLRALSGNIGAVKSYEKAGFKQEGILIDDVCLDGKYVDVVWMAITK